MTTTAYEHPLWKSTLPRVSVDNDFPEISSREEYTRVKYIVMDYLSSMTNSEVANMVRNFYALQRIEEFEYTHHVPSDETLHVMYVKKFNKDFAEKSVWARFLELFK